MILVGLVLRADDHGRGFAHSTLLGREIRGYTPEQIESALQELATLDLVILYQVGRHQYYSLPRWQEWQKLREPARSKFPPPPGSGPEQEVGESLTVPEVSTKNFEKLQEVSGTVQTVFQEGEKEKEEEKEGEGEEKRAPDDTPDNVLPFPAGRRESTTSEQKEEAPRSPARTQQTTREVAAILRLGETPALERIVEDYQHDPLLHLLGEADNAREYIDNPRRNRQKQCMTPAFFRRWLRREHEDAQLRQSPRHTTAATGVRDGTTAALPASPGHTRPVLPKSLMHLADQDQPGRSSSPVKEGHKP